MGALRRPQPSTPGHRWTVGSTGVLKDAPGPTRNLTTDEGWREGIEARCDTPWAQGCTGARLTNLRDRAHSKGHRPTKLDGAKHL